MKFRVLILSAVVCLASACVAHEKNGDRAAALGNWREAYGEYRQALSKKPDTPGLKEKYERARQEAATSAFKRAQSCATTSDWQCAVSESEFALGLDEGNAEIAAFKVSAAKSLSLARVTVALEKSRQGHFRLAFEELERAAKGSADPELAERAASARLEVVAAAEAEAERLRAAKEFVKAVSTMEAVVAFDGTKRDRLDAIKREYEQHLEEQYEAHARQGDAALAARRWADADRHFAAALQVKPGGRAKSLSAFAGGIARGEAAVQRRDFTVATEAYRTAVHSGQDGDGHAAEQLRRVEVRPYSVRIRSSFVKPLQPDGTPWVGNDKSIFGTLLKVGANLIPGGAIVTAAVTVAESIPKEMRPYVTVVATLPDGRKLATPSKQAFYSTYESRFVVATNYFDTRRVSFHVTGQGDRREEAGKVELTLKELLEARELKLADQSVSLLDLAVEPTDDVEPMFADMIPTGDSTNLATDFSMPTRSTTAYRLRSIQAGAYLGDYQNEMGFDGPPDLQVAIFQRNKTIFFSQVVQDNHQAEWSPSSVWLHVEPNEQLIVRVWDADATENDEVAAMTVTEQILAGGRADLKTPNGGYLRLTVEPRAVARVQ